VRRVKRRAASTAYARQAVADERWRARAQVARLEQIEQKLENGELKM